MNTDLGATDHIVCPACNQGRLYIDHCEYTTRNDAKVSMVIYVHERTYTCPKCDQFYIAGILPQSVQFQPAIFPAERPKEEGVIVTPPPGLKIVGH
jgi:hypothetical protein